MQFSCNVQVEEKCKSIKVVRGQLNFARSGESRTFCFPNKCSSLQFHTTGNSTVACWAQYNCVRDQNVMKMQRNCVQYHQCCPIRLSWDRSLEGGKATDISANPPPQRSCFTASQPADSGTRNQAPCTWVSGTRYFVIPSVLYEVPAEKRQLTSRQSASLTLLFYWLSACW